MINQKSLFFITEIFLIQNFFFKKVSLETAKLFHIYSKLSNLTSAGAFGLGNNYGLNLSLVPAQF